MGASDRLGYRIESIPLQEKWFGKQQQEFARFLGVFNEIGSQRWELVSYQALPVHGAITGSQRSTLFLARSSNVPWRIGQPIGIQTRRVRRDSDIGTGQAGRTRPLLRS